MQFWITTSPVITNFKKNLERLINTSQKWKLTKTNKKIETITKLLRFINANYYNLKLRTIKFRLTNTTQRNKN